MKNRGENVNGDEHKTIEKKIFKENSLIKLYYGLKL